MIELGWRTRSWTQIFRNSRIKAFFRLSATVLIANLVPTIIQIVFFPSVEAPASKRQLSFYLFTSTPLIYSTNALAVDTPNSIVTYLSWFMIDAYSLIYKPPIFRARVPLANAQALPRFLQPLTSPE